MISVTATGKLRMHGYTNNRWYATGCCQGAGLTVEENAVAEDKPFIAEPDDAQGAQEDLARILQERKKNELAEALKEAFLAIATDEGPTLATIKGQPTKEQVRAVSLDYALAYHNKREGTPEKVVSTAAVFFAYIMNGASA